MISCFIAKFRSIYWKTLLNSLYTLGGLVVPVLWLHNGWGTINQLRLCTRPSRGGTGYHYSKFSFTSLRNLRWRQLLCVNCARGKGVKPDKCSFSLPEWFGLLSCVICSHISPAYIILLIAVVCYWYNWHLLIHWRIVNDILKYLLMYWHILLIYWHTINDIVTYFAKIHILKTYRENGILVPS